MDLVRSGLASKVLPRELVENILQLVGFIRTHKSQLKVTRYPLHPNNKKQLIDSLDQCWQLVIQTAVVWDNVAKPMYGFRQPDWKSETTNQMRVLCHELVSRRWLRKNAVQY